jgi:ribose 5-phosphate isomerase A
MQNNLNKQDDLKQQVALRAVDYVENGMRLGLGTGSTAKLFVAALAASGKKIIGVPTSLATFNQAKALGIPLSTLDETPELDLTIDGADEIDPQLNLIKGGGAAHLREKIVAQASKKMIVIADETKLVQRLGVFPLPIEINIFGAQATYRQIKKTLENNGIEAKLSFRLHAEGHNLVTDGGHILLDAACGEICDSERLSAHLHAIAGVVEHGLFLNICTLALVAGAKNVQEIRAIN